jgi:hypothetical protein
MECLSSPTLGLFCIFECVVDNIIRPLLTLLVMFSKMKLKPALSISSRPVRAFERLGGVFCRMCVSCILIYMDLDKFILIYVDLH